MLHSVFEPFLAKRPICVMAHAVLAHGAGRDPAAPPVLDPNSVRRHFSSYPIVFGAGG